MEERYGFTRQEADGRVSHELLGTLFCQSQRQAEIILIDRGEWSGALIHHRADGRAVMSANHWHLHRDPNGPEMRVTETHLDIVPATITGGQLGDVITAIAHELSEPLTAINSYIRASQIGLHSPWPNWARQQDALTSAADQVVRTSKVLSLLRELGAALRDTR